MPKKSKPQVIRNSSPYNQSYSPRKNEKYRIIQNETKNSKNVNNMVDNLRIIHKLKK